MANIDFQNPDELYNKLKELIANNPDYTADELWDAMKERTTYQGVPLKEINIASDIKDKINIIANGGDIEPRELLDIEEGYAEQQQNKQDEEEKNMSFSEIAQKEGWDGKTNREKIKTVVDKYNTILNEIKGLVDDNNSGEGLSDKALEKYKSDLEEKKQQLKDIEQSQEFYNLMEDISKRGTGKILGDTGLMSPKINGTLDLIAGGSRSGGHGSDLFSDTDALKNGTDFVKNTIFDRIAYANMNSTTTPRDIARKFISSNGNPKTSKGENNDGKSSFYGPADEMKFGSDIDGSEGEGYLDKRNDQLAEHLAKKGIESREDINTFLSKYSSWVNAKDKWKENTLDELTKRIEKINPKKEETNKEDKKEDKEKDKEVFDKDSWVWKEDKDGYWNPNNDSPINGVEDSDKSYGDKSDKDSPINEVEQTPENNKYLYINETVKNIKSNKERIDYLKKHGFVVDKKTGFYTKNGMKTKVYKDGQYNPKYVKPDKKEGYNDRTKVEPSRDNDLQIALQESGYQGPRDANGNFLPITDEWLDLQESKKNLKDKSKK